MALDPVTNFGKVQVSTGYDAAATSVALSSGEGARLPDPGVSGAFNLTWWNSTDYADPADDPNREIVRCTARSTDTLTVTRAQEGTSASTKNTATKTYKMVLAPTKKLRDDIQTELDGKQPLDSDLTAIAAIAPSNDDVIVRVAGAWLNRTMAQLKTLLALVKGDVGLGNVDNTSDATKDAATATLTNKTLTTPKINAIHESTNNKAYLKGAAEASAVNEITITAKNTAGAPTIAPSGTDTNIDLKLDGKGTGIVEIDGPKLTVGSDADGDMYYRSSGVIARLPKGTASQEIRMNAGATAPEWYTPAAGGGITKQFIPASAFYHVSGGTDGANFGDYRTIRMTDAVKTEIAVNGIFSATPTAIKLVFIPGATGNMAWYTTTDFAADGAAYNANSDSEGSDATPQTTAMTANTLKFVDIIASFTGAVASQAFGLRFTRDGDDAADTVNNAVDFVGMIIEF